MNLDSNDLFNLDNTIDDKIRKLCNRLIKHLEIRDKKCYDRFTLQDWLTEFQNMSDLTISLTRIYDEILKKQFDYI